MKGSRLAVGVCVIACAFVLKADFSHAVDLRRDEPDELARRMLGSWVAKDAQLDFTFQGGFVRWRWIDEEALASGVPGPWRQPDASSVLMFGALHDSRTADPYRYNLTRSATNDWRLHLTVRDATAGSPTKTWMVRLDLDDESAEDRIEIQFDGEETFTSFERTPVIERETTRDIGHGYRLVNRIDVGARFHRAIEALLAPAEGTAGHTVQFRGMYAQAGDISPNGEYACVLLWPMQTIGGPVLAQVARVAPETALSTISRPLFIADSAMAMGSSIIPEPAVTWLDGETLLYTTSEAASGKGVSPWLNNASILINEINTEGKEHYIYKDAVTGATDSIEASMGFEFVRAATDDLYFLMKPRRLYPIDMEKRTYGPMEELPKRRDGKSPSEAIRELKEKVGGILR